MLSFPLSAWCVPCVGVRSAASTAPPAATTPATLADKCTAPVCCNLDAVRRRHGDAERALLGVTQVSDIALVRTALANAHGDVDDAVDWILLHQSQASSSSSSPAPEPQKQSPASAVVPEPKRTAPVGQKAAAAAAAELKKLEAAVAEGRALSKKQKRKLEKARRICAAAPQPPPPTTTDDRLQTSSAPQVSSILI